MQTTPFIGIQHLLLFVVLLDVDTDSCTNYYDHIPLVDSQFELFGF